MPSPNYNDPVRDVPDGRSNAAMDMEQDYLEELGGLSAGISTAKPEALTYEHPDYKTNVEKWAKYQRLYNSRDVYRYIQKHSREHNEMFEKRVARGYFLNYVSAVIDLFVAYLYHSPITRQPDDEAIFGALYKNADRRGTHYEVFIQQATTHAQVSGHCGILVDMPLMEQPIQSEADREALDHRPYLTIIQAHQIIDWELDSEGNFKWVKLEVFPPQDRAWNEPVDNETRHFLIWTREDWEAWKVVKKTEEGKSEEAIQEGYGVNTLGRVPLVIMRNEKDLDHSWMGISAVRDISDLNIAILNWCSLMDEEIYERCLNILAAQKSGNTNTAAIVLSHNNVLEYEGEQAPNYLTPGATPLQLIMAAISSIKDEIYRLAKLGGDTGLQKSRSATSGIAYAFEFNTTNQSLGKKAVAAEQAELEIHQLVSKWMGKEFSGTITYPKEFGVEDFLSELALLADARATLSSQTAIKELEKRITAKMFARDTQALRDKIAADIDSQDPKDPTLVTTSLGFGPPEPPGADEESGPVGGGNPSSATGKTG